MTSAMGGGSSREGSGGVPQKADKRNEAAGIMYMTGGEGQKFRKFCGRHMNTAT